MTEKTLAQIREYLRRCDDWFKGIGRITHETFEEGRRQHADVEKGVPQSRYDTHRCTKCCDSRRIEL